MIHFDSGRVAGPKNRTTVPACIGPWGTDDEYETREAAVLATLKKSDRITPDRREAIDCDACKAIIEETGACYGCEKPFKLNKDGGLYKPEVCQKHFAPNVVRNVCGNRRGCDGLNHYSHKPKLVCLQKALAKSHFCGACGKRLDRWESASAICEACRALLIEGAKREADREATGLLEMFVIDEEFFPIPDAFHWANRKARDELRAALAEACAGIGREWRKDARGIRLGTPAKGGPHGDRGTGSGPCVELTPAQADALRRVLMAWRATFETIARVHHEEGRSVLLAMARGEMTVDQINKAQTGESQETKGT